MVHSPDTGHDKPLREAGGSHRRRLRSTPQTEDQQDSIPAAAATLTGEGIAAAGGGGTDFAGTTSM